MFPFRFHKDNDDKESENKLVQKEEKIKKKNKDKPRQWTKKDRYILLSVIALTTLTSTFLGLTAREWKLPNFPRLSLPTINLEEKYVISKEKKENFDEVVKLIKDTTHNLSGVYGVYVSRLDGSGSYGIYEKEVFTAASLIKLPLLITLYKEAEEGRINLEEKYTLKDSDKIAGAGSLYYKPAGTVLTLRQLARYMGKESDNTAFGIVRKVLGDEKINKVVEELGMEKTSLGENKTTPKDIAQLFTRLWNNTFISKKSREEILEFLTDTSFESWISKGVPKGIRVAHKYGREVHVVNDAGIVFTDQPYIVVILSKGVVESEADAIFPELSRIIYEFEVVSR